MTSNDILRADLLDIIFEGRNKEYGAYALRREYPGRLKMSLSFVVLLLLALMFAVSFGKYTMMPGESVAPEPVRIVEVDPVHLLPEIPPPPAAQAQQQHTGTGERLFSEVIAIRPDQRVLSRIPAMAELSTAIISGRDQGADPYVNRPFVPVTPRQPGTPQGTQPVNPGSGFEPDEKDAEFPGGSEALRTYISSQLITPEEIRPGEIRSVHIRFIIGADGSVSEFEIVKSGGVSFDQELIRVCRKMPRWKPARQNGIYVPVTFLLPVSFVGIEE